MGDLEDYEEGEILEEGEEIESSPPQTNIANVSSATSLSQIASIENIEREKQSLNASTSEGLLPQPPISQHTKAVISQDTTSILPTPVSTVDLRDNHRKRVHSELQGPSQNYSRGNAPSHRAPNRERDDRGDRYSPDLILKYPRQIPSSGVLLEFSRWMDLTLRQSRHRLDVTDLQDLILNVMNGEPMISSYLTSASECPFLHGPTKICVVVLGNLHPSVLQRYRSELPFFDACTVMPCALTKSDQMRRTETPVAELLYRFAKPPVDTK